VGVSREIEPGDASLLAETLSDVAHEGDCHDWNGATPEPLCGALHLSDGAADGCGRGVAFHLNGEPSGSLFDDDVGPEVARTRGELWTVEPGAEETTRTGLEGCCFLAGHLTIILHLTKRSSPSI
jgi:hypothetical protein